MAIFRAVFLLGLAAVSQALTAEEVCVERVQCENQLRPDTSSASGGEGRRRMQTVTEATAMELAEAIIDPNLITVSDPVLTCAAGASGIVSFGSGEHAFDMLGFADSTAIVLTTGSAAEVEVQSNMLFGTTTIHDTPGTNLLSVLNGETTNDACILEFSVDVTPGFFTAELYFEFIFASEEYNEFVDVFDDIFALFIDDENVALVPGMTPPTPISVNTINMDDNSNLFMDNMMDPSFATEYDGFTTIISTKPVFVIIGQQLRVTMAIADALDSAFDSAVIIRASIVVAGGD